MKNVMSVLKDLGLSDQESNIYMTLLKIGGSRASEIAKSAGVQRTAVYATLKQLAKKGFVTLYFRHNKQYYYADKPSRVADYFEKRLDALYQLVPTLESLDKNHLQAVGLRFIETLDELKHFYVGVLSEYKGKSYRGIGNTVMWESLDKDFFQQYRLERAKAKIKTQFLIDAKSKGINPTDPFLLREWKYLPANYTFKTSMEIYKDKVLIISPELTSLAVVIAVPAMVDIFSAMFTMLWDFVPNNK